MGYVEQTAVGGLLDEVFEDIVNDVFEIGEKAINRISGWRFVESTIVPDEAVLKFSCDRACAIDIVVVPEQKATKEIWWLVNSCSPPLRGGEHVLLQQKLVLKILEQRYCLGSRDIREVVYRSYSLQGVELVDTVSKPRSLPWKAFYDTLITVLYSEGGCQARFLNKFATELRC